MIETLNVLQPDPERKTNCRTSINTQQTNYLDLSTLLNILLRVTSPAQLALNGTMNQLFPLETHRTMVTFPKVK